jgi:hypothetical protein
VDWRVATSAQLFPPRGHNCANRRSVRLVAAAQPPARVAASAGLGPVPEHPEDPATVQRWQTDWEWTGLGGVPLLMRGDRRPLSGLVPAAQLEAFVR